jgi:cytidylate kinase
MAIITVSRELAALGDETAHELANQLHYRIVDRGVLENRIKSLGVAESKLEKFDERKPSFWASFSQERDDYLHFLKTALLAEAVQGNCILIGRGAGVILKDVPGVLSVFLTAPPDIRLQRVKSYFHCDDRRARQVLEQADRDRDGFHRYFFDVKWKEVSNYHVTLNTGHLHPEACAEIIKFMKGRVISGQAEEQNAVRVRELALGLEVKHHILYEKKASIHFLEASAEGNKIILYGVANSQSLAEIAVAAAKEIAGAYEIHSEIQVVHEYNITP